ncbi:MAG: hypothetical protein H0X62_17815 [Bacteroidetes bacterium]|nr:hypothetical protein [Bacteroidota bacterium]
MSLTYRIFTYLIGISIGSLLVYLMLFRGREDRNLGAWLPNQRVLTQIEETKFATTTLGGCKLACLDIPEDDFKQYLEGANVAFGKSKTSKDPCPVYLINTTIRELPAEIHIEVCDSVSTLRNIEVGDVNCDC